ncbi:hypothetical protein OH492_07545 [Vibrio chagasii]|nr:hypothetical protein [Vibrio chagasii]
MSYEQSDRKSSRRATTVSGEVNQSVVNIREFECEDLGTSGSFWNKWVMKIDQLSQQQQKLVNQFKV